MTSERQAVVVGASVAGLATACGLTERGWNVTIIERRADLTEGGRAILLQPNGLAALERLGALDCVRERGHWLSRVVFYGRRYQPLAAWDYTELHHPHPYLVEIRPAALRSVLAERLAKLGGKSPRLGCELIGLSGSDGGIVGARYRDRAGQDHTLEAACVIGADGPDSTVRKALGIDCRGFPAPDRYLLGTVDVDGSADELAVYLGQGYGDGVVPLGDGIYFWDRVTTENRAAVETQDLDGWRQVFAGRLPPGSDLPAAVTGWEQLTAVHVRPFWTRSQIEDGVALVGDAAGAVHPHSAQGANLALEDALALADVLGPHTGGEPASQRRLSTYGRARRCRRRRVVLQSLLAAGFMDAPSPIWRAVRAANLGWSRVGPTRRVLLRLGLS
jgi:2-polyprenyl-6-methoxyphenol hydroxylase-like FAD-dependent oxidoreductase